MLGPTDLIWMALATNQIVETWHHGSLFARWRAYCDAVGGFWGELLGCCFCLSHWVAGAVVLLYCCPELVNVDFSWEGRVLIRLPVYWLGITRAAQLLNDVTSRWSRSPGRDLYELDEPDDEPDP